MYSSIDKYYDDCILNVSWLLEIIDMNRYTESMSNSYLTER